MHKPERWGESGDVFLQRSDIIQTIQTIELEAMLLAPKFVSTRVISYHLLYTGKQQHKHYVCIVK